MRTTININKDLRNRLLNTADMLHISSHDLIAMLVRLVISKNSYELNISRGVRYQNRDPVKNWETHHVTLDDRLYNASLDFRNFFKVSVSLLISFAILNFLDVVEKKLVNSKINNQKVDNYPLNYIVIAKMFDDIQGFIVIWGIPEEKKLKDLMP